MRFKPGESVILAVADNDATLPNIYKNVTVIRPCVPTPLQPYGWLIRLPSGNYTIVHDWQLCGMSAVPKPDRMTSRTVYEQSQRT